MSMEWQAKVVTGGKWYRREALDVEIWGVKNYRGSQREKKKGSNKAEDKWDWNNGVGGKVEVTAEEEKGRYIVPGNWNRMEMRKGSQEGRGEGMMRA